MFIQGYKFNNEQDYDAFMKNISYFNEKYVALCSNLKELKKNINQYSNFQDESVHFKNYILKNVHFFHHWHESAEYLINDFSNGHKQNNMDIKSFLSLFNNTYKLKKRGIENCFFKIVYDKKSLSVSFYSDSYPWFSFIEEKFSFFIRFYMNERNFEKLFFVKEKDAEPKIFGSKNCKYLKTVFKNEYGINVRHLNVTPY